MDYTCPIRATHVPSVLHMDYTCPIRATHVPSVLHMCYTCPIRATHVLHMSHPCYTCPIRATHGLHMSHPCYTRDLTEVYRPFEICNVNQQLLSSKQTDQPTTQEMENINKVYCVILPLYVNTLGTSRIESTY